MGECEVNKFGDGLTYWSGRIKFFKRDKNYGFIQLDRGHWLEVYFRMNSLHRLECVNQEGSHYPKWIKIDLNDIESEENFPQRDDRVVCRIEKRDSFGEKLQLRAIMWCYEPDYIQFLEINRVKSCR